MSNNGTQERPFFRDNPINLQELQSAIKSPAPVVWVPARLAGKKARRPQGGKRGRINRMTRATFENRLGGEFTPHPKAPGHRFQMRNKGYKYHTYKAPSKVEIGRDACFLESPGIGTVEARSWDKLARLIRLSGGYG